MSQDSSEQQRQDFLLVRAVNTIFKNHFLGNGFCYTRKVETILHICVFIFGLIIGSFLNVIILRLDTGLGFGGRSMCFSCGKKLSWYELIPLFSFLFLRGKCHGCGQNISFQYPLVELVTAVSFLLLFLKAGMFTPWYVLVAHMVLFSSLIVIAVFDIRHMRIPWKPLLTVYGSVLFLTFAWQDPVLPSLFSGLALATPFLLLSFFSKERLLGYGDGLLMIFVGYWLGISGGIITILIASIVGSLVGIGLMASRGRYGMGTAIPFGPFIVLGALISFLYTIDIEGMMYFFSSL